MCRLLPTKSARYENVENVKAQLWDIVPDVAMVVSVIVSKLSVLVVRV